MKRIMAIDYGDARTGIAMTDLLCSLVGSTTVIHSWDPETVKKEICRLAKENDVGELIMGYPKNMDGTEGPRAEKYKAFAEDLKAASGLPVTLWDERRTTIEAHQILADCGQRAKKRKNVIDAVAASLILESYLAFRR